MNRQQLPRQRNVFGRQKAEFKFLRFSVYGSGTGTARVWDCHSKKGDYLGMVSWESRWKKFVFNPGDDTVFDAACLDDVARFLRSIR